MNSDAKRSQGIGRYEADPLRGLLVHKIGIEPGTLRGASPAVASRYESQWAPAEELASHLRPLPAGMLRFLLRHPTGYLLVSDHSAYEPGEREVQTTLRTNVAYCNIAQVSSPFVCIRVVANLLDHLLGCDGRTDGPWLSDGGGIDSRLSEIGAQIVRLYDLGYGIDEGARQDRHSYLARSLAWYVIDRRELNVADPRMERLLKHSLMNERFWS